MSEPEFLTQIEAKTALETPQVVVSWTFNDSIVPPSFAEVARQWLSLYLRRSDFKFPESKSEYTEMLTEVYSSDPSTSFADVTPDALKEHYYSLFFDYVEFSSHSVHYNQDISRLGARIASTKQDGKRTIVQGTDGSSAATSVFTSAGSTFLTSGVESGDILEISEGGADDGYYSIESVDSETQITLATTLTLTASNVNFAIHSGDIRFWLSSVNYRRQPTLYRWNASRGLVDYKIDLSEVLYLDEFVESIAFSDTVTKSASDGETSAPTEGSIVSASSTFKSDGVRPGDILEITGGSGDDGFYTVFSVDTETRLVVEEDWATGSLSGLSFTVHSKHVSFVTSFRYIRIPEVPWNSTHDSADIVVQWNLTDTPLSAGYSVTGSLVDFSVLNASDVVYLLDATHAEIKIVNESDGTTFGSHDISGLSDTSSLHGLAVDVSASTILVGNSNYVYGFLYSVSSPGISDINSLTYLRQAIDFDIGFYKSLISATKYVIVVDNDTDKVQTYEIGDAKAYLWQQPYIADNYTVALWHLDEAVSVGPVDSGPNGNDAANNGMTEATTGRFSTGFLADSVTEYIDLTDSGGNTLVTDVDGTEGSVSIWFQASSASSFTSGTSVLFDLRVDANNLVRIGVDSGQLTFEYIAGGTASTVQGAHPSADTEFHEYVITWSVTADEVKAYVDGIQFGTTQSSLGIWVGTPVSATLGSASASLLGIYDEVHISSIARDVFTPVTLTTQANKAYAYSGRDYEATYEDDDPLGFHYRDEFFSPKFMGGEFIIRNDYLPEPLHPQDKTLETGEVIFRGPVPLPSLGHTGRLTRLLGLYIDRIADSREQMLDYFNRYNIDLESIPAAAEFLGLPGLDSVNWNVDQQRRFLRIMPIILKRAARNVSYLDYARFLGFLAKDDHLQSRRRLDSVHYNATFDSNVQAIPLDTMGSLDTSDENFPLALLRWRFYIRSTKSTTGQTSVPASRLLTDSAATFSTTCSVGSLVRIKDPDDTDDNDDYIVTEVHSDTEIKVNKDWPVGSLTGLTYTNNWEVPFPDPYAETLLERYREHIAPASMKTMHVDEAV